MDPSQTSHQQSSSEVSHRQSPDDSMPPPPGRKRVGFTSDTPAITPLLRTPEEYPPDINPFDEALKPESGLGSSPGQVTPAPGFHRPDVSEAELSEQLHKAFGQPYIPKPRPAIRKTTRTPPAEPYLDHEDHNSVQRKSGIEAQQRATRLAQSVGTHSHSAPASRRNSNERLMPHGSGIDIPLNNLGHEMAGDFTEKEAEETPKKKFMEQADEILRHHTIRGARMARGEDFHYSDNAGLRSGHVTPDHDGEIEAEYVPRPSKFRTGILGTLLKAQGGPASVSTDTLVAGRPGRPPLSRDSSYELPNWSVTSTAANSPRHSPTNSGTSTPIYSPRGLGHWRNKSANRLSTGTISKLLDSSTMLASPGQEVFGREMAQRSKNNKSSKRTKSSQSLSSAFFGKPSREDQIKIKIHLAGFLARQTYLRKLCKALMMYGAPTHRLEEYMNMSARVLEIEAQFLYIPGCMIMSFDDSSVHTTEVKLVRVTQGVDLGKLRDTHEIYKDVVHDRIGVEEATPRLEAIMARKAKFNAWLRIPVYGLASATVGPFAFQARPIDLPFCFLLGCILGWLQLIAAPGNEMIANVFEISAAVITSFIARGLGSIRHDGKEIFCFSAMAQSSIALILPGFTVLSASLELQSRHIVAGSVRMVYAIIYSLFLGFGITIGTVLFGMLDKNATSATTCENPMSSYYYYPFVAAFTLCLIIINQGKYKQIPAMLTISLIGYVVNFHSSQYFKKNAQVSNTLGALAIGVTANLHARFGRHVENWSLDLWEHTLRPRYMRFRKRWLRGRHGPQTWHKQHKEIPSHSRASSIDTTTTDFIPSTRKIGYGLAAAAMLPAIFVQVPSGLSVNGSLVSGITSADQITRNASGVSTISNGTQAVSGDASSGMNSVALSVGFSVVQVAIGITVGLFLAALIVYPVGKRRSGLFSF